MRVRYGEMKEEEKARINHAMDTIARKLTPQQRQFWFRIAHKNYMTNNRAHKWKLSKGERAPNECNVCHAATENWEHMEYDCDGVQKWLKRLKQTYENYTEKKHGEWRIPTRDEWNLKQHTEMNEDMMIVIAISRWMYHKERSKLVHRQRRRMDFDRIEENVVEELKLIKEKWKEEGERKEKEEREEGEEKKRKKRKKERRMKEIARECREERRKKARERREKKKRRPPEPMVGWCINSGCPGKGEAEVCPCQLKWRKEKEEKEEEEEKIEEREDRREADEDRRQEIQEKKAEEDEQKKKEEQKREEEKEERGENGGGEGGDE